MSLTVKVFACQSTWPQGFAEGCGIGNAKLALRSLSPREMAVVDFAQYQHWPNPRYSEVRLGEGRDGHPETQSVSGCLGEGARARARHAFRIATQHAVRPLTRIALQRDPTSPARGEVKSRADFQTDPLPAFGEVTPPLNI